MGPIVKTYGGYKPKRKGLPKYVVKETLETSGNVFSALHIDNLKMIRGGDNVKPKTCKMTLTKVVRDMKPTLDDSLDSTFDKIIKSAKDKSLDGELIHDLGTKKNLDTSTRCWTCGCCPTIDMAHHLLYECKEDSFYLNPSPKTIKIVTRKVKQVKNTIDKEKRKKKLKLQKSPMTKTLKRESPAKKQMLVKPKSDFISPCMKSPLKTPNFRELRLSRKSGICITSTPQFCDRRKFNVEISPVLAERTKERIADTIPNVVEPVLVNKSIKFDIDTCGNAEVICNNFQDEERIKKDSCRMIFSDVKDKEKTMEDFCRVQQLFTDEVLTENSQHGETKDNTAADPSCDIIESSFGRQSRCPRPSGYITKRRMWRRTRRTAFNLSVDMFNSNNQSLEDQSIIGDTTSGVDRLQVVTPRNDKSFCSRKEQTLAQQHFSISCEINEGVNVQLAKSESYFDKSNVSRHIEYAYKSNNCKISDGRENVVSNHSSLDLNVNELSRALKVSLTLLSEDVIQKQDHSLHDSDVDMFSGLSEQFSRCNFESKSNFSILSADQKLGSTRINVSNSISSQLSEKPSLKSSPILTKDISRSFMDESVENSLNGLELDGEKSFSVADISEDNVSFELVLKPCYVKLLRSDTQTVANVTYASHCNMSVSEDVHEVIHEDQSMVSCTEVLNESDHSVISNVEHNASLETVVTLPLSMLGKLDKITIRGSSKISQQSLESIVHGGKFLEPSVEKLWEMQTDENPADDHAEIEDANQKNMDDFREVLLRCGQTEPRPFSVCYPESMFPKCKKIGEGAYGEVFLYNSEKQKTVIKIIPIEGDIEINAAVQKKFWEIKPEIFVAQELSALRKTKTGLNCCDVFNEVLAVRCVQGKYPQWMLDLWRAFDKERGSENDCPDVFGDDQLFIVLELAHGGQDLESYEFTSADQAVAAITQIAFALAVGESEIQFEHRDLHWGNVLVAPTKAKATQFTLGGEKFKVPTKGVKVSVIDFTMSRMTMPTNGENMFYDFGHDDELFAAQGDYQCDIYRLMRERTRNNWAVYEPFTNILWLHYLLDKMCSMVAYRNQHTKTHELAMAKLTNMRDSVLAYSSATAFSSSDLFKSSRAR